MNPAGELPPRSDRYGPLQELADFASRGFGPVAREEHGKLILALLSDFDEAQRRITWLEQHGPNCECRECRIP